MEAGVSHLVTAHVLMDAQETDVEKVPPLTFSFTCCQKVPHDVQLATGKQVATFVQTENNENKDLGQTLLAWFIFGAGLL